MPSARSSARFLVQAQATDEVGEQRLLDADQRVTMDAGLVLEPISGPTATWVARPARRE